MTWFQRMLQKIRGEKPVALSAPPTHGMDMLCQQYTATYIRDVFGEEVQLTLIREDATLTARAKNTADALALLSIKAEQCWSMFRV